MDSSRASAFAALTLSLMLAAATPSAAQTLPAQTLPAPADAVDTAAYPAPVKVVRIPDGYRYVDRRGMTLYMLDPRETRARAGSPMRYCVGPCAERFAPLAAAPGAPAAGLWKPLEGPGGWQWTYQGSPVFTSPLDTRPGETNGDGFEDVVHPIEHVPAAPVITAPAVVAARYVKGQWYLADDGGHVLFTHRAAACNADCPQPLLAGMAARAVGEWSVVPASGDRLQWAWRRKPVYLTATADALPPAADGTAIIAKTN